MIITQCYNQKLILINLCYFYIPKDLECDVSDNLNVLETLNKQLNNDSCPNGFDMLKDQKTCIHEASNMYSYDEATRYCTEKQGSDLLYFESYEELESLHLYGLNFSGKILL